MRAALVFFAALSSLAADLDRRLDAVVHSGTIAAHSSTGIHVVDLTTGKTLYRHNEERLFLPASNMKLFTTALALLRLGPEYRFVTRLVREPSGDLALASGVQRVDGDIVGDDRLFPWAPYPPSWTQDDELREYGAPVSALTVAD